MNNSGIFSLVVLLLVGWSSGQTICPDSSLISPCICSDNSDGVTTALNCFGRNVNDDRVNDILDVFLAPTSRASPLGNINLATNFLTKVPSQISSFRLLQNANLAFNSITSIGNKAFSFSAAADLLDLRSDSRLTQINSIEVGAFLGNYVNSSYIYLSGNNLTRFEAGVFQPVMQKIISKGGGYPNGYVWMNLNPIDCASDPCHLAWLIFYNRNLLPAVVDGQCSNGTRFEQLNQSAFFNCPVQFVCPDSDGNYANPSSCNNFYTCIDSKPYLTQCPVDGATGEQLVYNPSTGRCDKKENVPICQ